MKYHHRIKTMNMKTKITVDVIGNDREVVEFIRLCKYIQSFGTYGMSRTVHVNIDGDGSGHLRFEDNTIHEELSNIPLDALHKIEEVVGEYNIDIGE
jgi:hypothetical protein